MDADQTNDVASLAAGLQASNADDRAAAAEKLAQAGETAAAAI